MSLGTSACPCARSLCVCCSLSCLRFRRVAVEVIEITLAAQYAHVGLLQAAHTLVQWYNISRKETFTPVDLVDLKRASDAVTETWRQIFVVDVPVHELNFPKMHRFQHIPPAVPAFGPFNSLSSEFSESAHKQFKKLYRWYVCVCVCV